MCRGSVDYHDRRQNSYSPVIFIDGLGSLIWGHWITSALIIMVLGKKGDPMDLCNLERRKEVLPNLSMNRMEARNPVV